MIETAAAQKRDGLVYRFAIFHDEWMHSFYFYEICHALDLCPLD